MKKIFVTIFLLTGLIFVHAQKVKTKAPQPLSKILTADVLFKAELNLKLTGPPIFSKDKIYAAGKSGAVTCIDTTCKVLWKRERLGELASNPIIADDQVAVGTLNGDIITLNAQNGQQLQSIGLDDSISTNIITIEFQGDKELFMPKTNGSKSALVFGTASGKVVCLDLETLQEYWRNNDAKGFIKSQPLLVDNKILFTSKDGFIYCIDAKKGFLIWRWKEKEETDFSNSQLLTDGKSIFAVSSVNELYAIDLLLGKLAWKSDVKVFPFIGISQNGKQLYSQGLEKKIFIFRSDKENAIKEIKLEEKSDSLNMQPVENDGIIFFSNKGKLFSLDSKFNAAELLNLGEAHIQSLAFIGENKIIAATTNGTIIIFRIRYSLEKN